MSCTGSLTTQPQRSITPRANDKTPFLDFGSLHDVLFNRRFLCVFFVGQKTPVFFAPLICLMWDVFEIPTISIVLPVGEEGTDPCPGPTEDRDNEWDSNFVAGLGKVSVVNGPEGDSELDQLLSTEQMLGLLLVYDRALFGQGIPHPLVTPNQLGTRISARDTLTLYTARRSSASIRLPVTRANPAKNHSAKVFIESTVTSLDSWSRIPSLTEVIKRRKSLMVARPRGGSPSRRLRASVV